MSRRRSPAGKRSDEGQYVPLPYAMIKSQAWRALSGPAVKLWLELHTRFNGGNNGKVFLSMNEAAEILGLGKATVQRVWQSGFGAVPHCVEHRTAADTRVSLGGGARFPHFVLQQGAPRQTERDSAPSASVRCRRAFERVQLAS